MLHQMRLLTIGLVAALLLLGIAGFTRPTTAGAAACAVTTLADSGGGSLREKLADVTCGTITFGVTGTVTLASPLPDIDRALTLAGPGRDSLTIDGGNTVILLVVNKNSSNTVTISGLTLAHSFGAGVYISQGTVHLLQSRLSDSMFGGAFIRKGIVTFDDVDVRNNANTTGGGGIDNVGGTVTLTNSTISGNTTSGTFGNGGGIFNYTDGTLIVLSSTISGNKARFGGGIDNQGTATIVNSTISGNTATFSGGGLFHPSSATVTTRLAFVTLTGNVADSDNDGVGQGGAIAIQGGTITAQSSIVAGNTRRAGVADDCAGAVVSQGHNLFGASPCPGGGTDRTLAGAIGTALNPTLADNGGPTKTHALVPGSPAIDHGDNTVCATASPNGAGGKDQRGANRGDGNCDSGAVEFGATIPSPSPSPSTTPCGQAFGDVSASDPACAAIEGLAARGIIKGCDSSVHPPLFCPNDPTLREQMAALIVRAIPAWVNETGQSTFTDNTADTELMTRVATLQRHGVVRGYQPEVCTAQQKATPCYGPLDNVTYGQSLLFIARAMVASGTWVLQADDRTIFPDQNGVAGADPNTDQQTLDHRAVVTYVFYLGSVPDVADVHANFSVATPGGAKGWADATPRAWFARALWNALMPRA